MRDLLVKDSDGEAGHLVTWLQLKPNFVNYNSRQDCLGKKVTEEIFKDLKCVIEKIGNLKSQSKECVDAKNQPVAVLTDVRRNLEARHRDHHLVGKC